MEATWTHGVVVESGAGGGRSTTKSVQALEEGVHVLDVSCVKLKDCLVRRTGTHSRGVVAGRPESFSVVWVVGAVEAGSRSKFLPESL